MNEHHASPVTAETVLVLKLVPAQVRGDEMSAAIDREFTDAIERSGATKVAIDCGAVEFISSAGLRPLLALQQRFKGGSGRVVLCHLTEAVDEVLHVVKFIDTSGSHPAPFEVQPDLLSAVTSLLK